MNPVKLIIISGRSGSDKTSIAHEIHHQVSKASIHHASIEDNNLDMMFPEQNTPELFLANLTSCWYSFYHLKSPRTLVLNGTAVILDHKGIKKAIRDVCEDVVVETKPVVLHCRDECVSRRLTRREKGGALEEHLARSKRMAKISKGVEGERVEHVRT